MVPDSRGVRGNSALAGMAHGASICARGLELNTIQGGRVRQHGPHGHSRQSVTGGSGGLAKSALPAFSITTVFGERGPRSRWRDSPDAVRRRLDWDGPEIDRHESSRMGSSGSLIANFVIDIRNWYAQNARLHGQPEGEVVTLRVTSTDSGRAQTLCCLAAVAVPPRGSAGGPSETRPTTGRVSDTLDLAAAIRLAAGDDITPQWFGVSSREETGICLNSNPCRGSGGRRAGGSGRGGFGIPACSSGPSLSG